MFPDALKLSSPYFGVCVLYILSSCESISGEFCFSLLCHKGISYLKCSRGKSWEFSMLIFTLKCSSGKSWEFSMSIFTPETEDPSN